MSTNIPLAKESHMAKHKGFPWSHGKNVDVLFYQERMWEGN